MAKEQVLYKNGLALYDQQSVIRMNTAIGAAKDEAIASAANAFRYASVKDNSIEFYSVNPITEESAPVVTVDLPTELYLDQTKTTFVNEFHFDETTYPGATNPNMEGEPVIVLAVKGSDASVTYSFMNMKTLIDIYTGGTTSTVAVSIDPSSNIVTANVKVSAEEGNLVQIKEDGLYVAPVDQSAKADKLTVGSADQILVDDGNGNLKGSGKTLASVAEDIAAAQSAAEGKAATAQAAAEAAQDAADAAQADVDALETLVGTLPEDATADTVVGYAKEVAAASQAAAEGKAATAQAAAEAAQSAADAAQADVNALETLVGAIPDGATADTVVGYAKEVADAAQAAAEGKAATAQAAAEAAQADVDALETLVGTLPEGITSTTVVGYIKEAADAAQKEADDRILALEQKVGEGYEPISDEYIMSLFTPQA